MKNVFVAYNYADTNVAPLNGVEGETTVKDYADAAVKALKSCKTTIGKVYRSKDEEDDLTGKLWAALWSEVKDEMGDIQGTIVLVSPNLVDSKKPLRSQWAPWSIYFSVHKMNRNDGTNDNVPVAVVVLPDKKGSTAYFDENQGIDLIKENIANNYIYVTNWNLFARYPDMCMDIAAERKPKVSLHDLCYTI